MASRNKIYILFILPILLVSCVLVNSQLPEDPDAGLAGGGCADGGGADGGGADGGAAGGGCADGGGADGGGADGGAADGGAAGGGAADGGAAGGGAAGGGGADGGAADGGAADGGGADGGAADGGAAGGGAAGGGGADGGAADGGAADGGGADGGAADGGAADGGAADGGGADGGAADGGAADGGAADGGSDYTKSALESATLGTWVIDNPDAGVAAMQLQLMPNDQVVWFDTTSLGPSGLKLPEGTICPTNPDAGNQPDCYVHAIAYDWKTSKTRPLTLQGDAWCSSGNLWPNGNLMATGGTFSGHKAIRVLKNDDPNADFDTRIGVLADGRWYSSNQVIEDGSVVVLGGRESYSYEIVPPQMEFEQKRFDFPFLRDTTTPALGPGRPVENNLYPFLFLLPDGNIFVFANNRAVTFEPLTGNIVRDFPTLEGGSRNYPPSASAALLPLKLTADNQDVVAEVVICGGNLPNAYEVVDAKHVTEKEYMPALQDCNRILPLVPESGWVKDQEMPSPRTMGDLIHLANADLLMLNGAKKGTSGWEDSTDANKTPVLFMPYKPMGERFRELAPTDIARVYHSCSALLPDTRVLVAGSNPHQFYTFNVEFPTELRVEKFSPPYLDPEFDEIRPVIDPAGSDVVLKYGQPFKVAASLPSGEPLILGESRLTMLYPPFTTHGFSQSQRMLIPAITDIQNNVITAVAPASGKLAPPGYYILYVNCLGVPGPGIWIHVE